MGTLVSKYYGINDLATQWEVKSLIEEKIGNEEFEKWIENTLKSPITTLEEFIDNMNARVILQYQELIDYLNSNDYKLILESFYSKILKFATIKDVELKLIKYINVNIKQILRVEDKIIKSETLQFILQKRGFSAWQTIIDDYDSVGYLGFNHFDETQKILKKVDKRLHYQFLKKILLPLNIHANLKHQLEIVNSIRKKYEDIADEYEKTVMEYLMSKEFLDINSYQKQTIVKCIIDSRCFNNKNEILLNKMLLVIESEVREMVSITGKAAVISSEKYMVAIQEVEYFREKLFLLIYVQHISILHLMMIEKEELSVLDIGNYNGISKNKYKNSTLMNISRLKMQMQVNTLALINNYTVEFWNELNGLINDVINITKISDFLKNDIVDIRFLIDNGRPFMTGTLLTQIIERLLRELYFKLEYGVVGILKNSNFTLKYLLVQDEEKNPLSKLFQMKELEALNFFLNDRENGENLRNNIAHYLIDSNELSEMDVIFLLDILIFILLKVDYQGTVFDNN